VRSARPRNGARQASGEPPADGAGTDDLEAAIAALKTRAIEDLRTEWRALHRTAPPSRLSRDLLVRAIAYQLQEKPHRGLSLATQRRLNELAKLLSSKGPRHFDPGLSLKPGSRLVREWHGRTHTVIVLEDGFEYEGKHYRSLTRIATLITGVHWSGPTFFGLKRRPPAAPEPSRE
jgi:Protein of unknown function (DUF2924)